MGSRCALVLLLGLMVAQPAFAEVKWMYVLVTMPVLAGDPGRATTMLMIDQASCLKQAMGTLQIAIDKQDALQQAFCLPQEDAAIFVTAIRCHDAEHHFNPDRLNFSCEGIVRGPRG